MFYNSKKTIINMTTGILLTLAYAIYALGDKAPAPDNLKAWAIVMLSFIAISIVVIIIVQILYHIALTVNTTVKEKEQDDKQVKRIIKTTIIEDERDKIINLKSAHIGYSCVGLGFIVALVTLTFGMTTLLALHIILGSFVVGSLAEAITNIYLHEKGV